MQPKVTLNTGKPIGALIDLLGVFDKAHCDGEPLRAKVQSASDIAEDDVKIIVAAQKTVVKALLRSNYEFARLAYQVLDYKLRTVVEPVITPDLITMVGDDAVLWACNAGENVITKADILQIANAINAVRTIDRVGTPENAGELDIAAVLEYGMR